MGGDKYHFLGVQITMCKPQPNVDPYKVQILAFDWLITSSGLEAMATC